LKARLKFQDVLFSGWRAQALTRVGNPEKPTDDSRGSREGPTGSGDSASGTIAGLLTRRYHGLLFAALAPPGGRKRLVTKLEDTAEYGGRKFKASRLPHTSRPEST